MNENTVCLWLKDHQDAMEKLAQQQVAAFQALFDKLRPELQATHGLLQNLQRARLKPVGAARGAMEWLRVDEKELGLDHHRAKVLRKGNPVADEQNSDEPDVLEGNRVIVAASKFLMLKPGEYEIWRMRIEQYIQMIDYALWEVIENGATFPKTTTVEGVVIVMPITTAKEKAQRRLEDAKKLLEAVEMRFGGNAATRKTQRNL
ncbi:hypothetical protein Tco_0369925, partial [Tanacetum coccineum]